LKRRKKGRNFGGLKNPPIEGGGDNYARSAYEIKSFNNPKITMLDRWSKGKKRPRGGRGRKGLGRPAHAEGKDTQLEDVCNYAILGKSGRIASANGLPKK